MLPLPWMPKNQFLTPAGLSKNQSRFKPFRHTPTNQTLLMAQENVSLTNDMAFSIVWNDLVVLKEEKDLISVCLQIEREKAKSKACKQKRLKQEVEFQHRLEDSARRHQQELAALTVRFEEDKSRLLQDFRHHEDQLRSESETNASHLKQIHQQEINALEMRVREVAELHSKAGRYALVLRRNFW